MKKYIAVAVLMLAVILSGCGGSKKSSTSTPPLNWDGDYYSAVDNGTVLHIVGNGPTYLAAATSPCGSSSVNITVDSWDSSQTSSVTLVESCGGILVLPQEWKLLGKTITITFTGEWSSNTPVVFTK
jgi:hypothetical protein